jgi:hypothetical protein
MMPPLFFYQLAILGLLWLCVMLPLAWSSRGPVSSRRSVEPETPVKSRRKRSNAPTPFVGLTHKPPWALGAHEASHPTPPPPMRPDPMSPTNRRPREVDTSYSQKIQTRCCTSSYASTMSPGLSLNFMTLSPILIIHVRRRGRGERGMDWKKLLGSLTESVDEELRLRNAYLVAENRMLRQQISGRVHLTVSDRQALAELGPQLGKKALEEMATVAKPDTILAWHRTFAAQQGDRVQFHKSVGRPRIAKEIEDLVVRMARENRSWGYDRIVGALTNLGYCISDQTVGNILKRHGVPPAPVRKTTTTWKEFIRMHMAFLRATDFFTKEVWQRCALVISALCSFLYGGFRHVHAGGMTFYHHALLRLTSLPRSLAMPTYLPGWLYVISTGVLSPLILCGKGVRRPPLSALTTHGNRAARPQGTVKVMRIPLVRANAIRAGPLRRRLPLSEWRQDARAHTA